MMWHLALEFVITLALVSAAVWVGYRQGYTAAMHARVEDLAKNARHKANRAKAEADVLSGAVPPRVRQVRIKGTSRRGLND
jgi:hypothetical protein